jgi:membrane-associated protein
MSFLSALDPHAIIATLGLIGVIAVVFAETGLLIGFFLPGDSLLFTAGLLASQGHIPFAGLLIGAFVAAVVGDSVGYAIGKKVGPAIFTKDNSVFFDKKHITRAQHFYEKYGKKTIILARFLPIIRTFAPVVAGVGSMPYKIFLTFNVIGGLVWTWGMSWFGFIFGKVIPNPDRYIVPMIVLIIVVSATPTLRQIFKKRDVI